MSENLIKGGPQTGVSVRLSAYLAPDVAARLELMQRDVSGRRLAQLLAPHIEEVLREAGYEYRRCPNCGAVHLERDLIGGLQDDWMCPTCRVLSDFGAWKVAEGHA